MVNMDTTGGYSAGGPGVGGARVDGPAYESIMVVGAILLTVFLPLIALIAALAIRSGEVIESRRRFLKNWAIASAVWLCSGFVIVLIALAAVGSAVSG